MHTVQIARETHGRMSDPFAEAQTVEFGAPVHEPAPTSFKSPNGLDPDALIGSNAQWVETGCHMTVEIPVGGRATISGKSIDGALASTIGKKIDETVVIPTGFKIIGAHCCNPTGTAVGLRISGANEPHVHISARAGEAETFSAVISSRYHPVGDFVVSRKGEAIDEEKLATRVEIAQKWAGVSPDQLLTGVQRMVTKKAEGDHVKFAVPVVVPKGEPTEDPETGEKSVDYGAHPLAWVAEKNMAALGDQITSASMPDSINQPVQHLIMGEKTLQDIITATHEVIPCFSVLLRNSLISRTGRVGKNRFRQRDYSRCKGAWRRHW